MIILKIVIMLDQWVTARIGKLSDAAHRRLMLFMLVWSILWSVYYLCEFATGRKIYLLFAIGMAWCSVFFLHSWWKSCQYSRLFKEADYHLAAGRKELDALQPNYNVVEHHDEQLEACVLNIRRLSEEKDKYETRNGC